MTIPTPRFTGIFIPVEVLELDSLSQGEMILLSWIHALYCKEAGGCFASNAYLAEKLKVKENTIVKQICKLRELGLVEDVSFNGRTRILKACIWKAMEKGQSHPACDLNHTQGMTKITTPTLSPYLYKSKKKERVGANAPALPLFSLPSIKRAPHVSTTEKDHEKLVAKFGAECIEAAYKILSEWKEDTPKSKWKKNDSRSLERWAIDAAKERKFKKATFSVDPDENKILANKVASKYKNRQDIILGHDYIEFVNGPTSEHIGFSDKAFKERLANQLRKRNL
jgi:hypothetical protein